MLFVKIGTGCCNWAFRAPFTNIPDSKVRVAHMGPTWVLSAPGGPHVGPMNLVLTEIRTWINNYIHDFIWDVIIHACYSMAWSVKAWTINYIPLFYIDVITYPFPNLDAYKNY